MKEDVPDHGSASVPPPPPVVNFIPIRVEHGGGTARTEPQRGGSGMSAAPTKSQPREGSVESSSGGVRTMPRSPAPPRRSGQQEGGGEDQPLLTKLDTIRQEVEKLGERIQNFKGSRSDKEYLYLDDMLTKKLIALDGIDTAGREEIRQLRKDSISFVNRCLSRLDEKATENLSEQQAKEEQQAADQTSS